MRSRTALEEGRFDVVCPVCKQTAEAVPTAEDRPLDPISIYGWTKKVQEEQCQLAADMHGLSVVVLRYFNVYGSRQSLVNPYTGIISIFLARLMAEKPIFLYEHGEPLRDFVHVSDVVAANIAAAEADQPINQPINIGTGKAVSVVDLARALGRAVNKEPIFEDRGEFRIGDIHACYADLKRAQQVLSYTAKMSLDEGLREVVNWASQHGAVDLYDQAVSELKQFGLFSQAKKMDQS